MRHGVDQQLGPDAGLAGAAHALAHAAQQLGEDHARIATGAHEGPVADGLAHLGQTRRRVDALELAHHGLEREGHVGPGVPVGHRVDVQPVDVGLVQPECVAVPPHDGAQVVGAEGRRGGHGR